MTELNIKIKKNRNDAIIPQYAHSTDTGLDLVGIEIIKNDLVNLWFDTGLSIEIPEGYVGYIFPRSSISKTNLMLANSVGVIDSGYRGSIQIRFNKIFQSYNNVLPVYFTSYKIGEKMAQLVIMPYPKINLIEVSELNESDRGIGGFGSTDKS